MSITESQAAFEQRCNELTPNGSLRAALVAQGIRNHSMLAFSVGSPQVPPTEAQFDTFAQVVYGRGPTIGELSNLKRLHFESTTLSIASLKQTVANESDQQLTVKRLPIAEKRARADDQATRLSGMRLVGELEPSHSLVDLANHVLETGTLIWIAPSKCSKRDDEIQLAVKERSSTIQVENSVLKVAQVSQEVASDVGSELKLQWSFQRRGIAFDRCGLVSWAVHERWITTILGTLSRPSPPGFSSVKTEQIVRADRELFTLLAQEHRGTLKATGGGAPPLDALLTTMITDPRVTMFLLPLPSHSKSSLKSEDAGHDRKTGHDKEGDPKKKKRKVSRADKACPDDLKKFKLDYEHGRICWGFNMKDGCKGKTEKSGQKPAKCGKGYHVCANCHKPGHSVLVCRALQQS